ncbi:hypothetical protein [Pedobacter ureilyticus]|uniref:Uncharacterized protein n=1 Tax=Pedobacter ureilyticus TaxID=1393051 RepID=A0ABW9J379_9SPHI|nr:hypothetical protein [Pedobacter helvus]
MRGIVHEISDIEFTGQNNDYPRQRVTLYCPSQRDQHTQKPLARDEFFMLDILGNKVDELNIHEQYLDKVVEVEVRFYGACYKKHDETRGYAVNCRLVNMNIITPAAAEFTRDAVELEMGY